MALPMPQPPPEPRAEPGEGAASDDDDQSTLNVPAAQTVAPLQPAKMAVWRMFVEQVRPLQCL